jgi:cobaltochelatase CobS
MLNIVLPAEARNAVRSMIRNHPDFEAFRLANGAFDSRNMDKAMTMRAIEFLGLEQDVTFLLADLEGKTPSVSETMPETAKPVAPSADAASLMATVIDPLAPFLAPTLLDNVRTALAPIVDRALKPIEIERVVTKTVTVDSDGQAIQPETCAMAQRDGKQTLQAVYGLPKSKDPMLSKPVQLWTGADGVPAIDPFYVADVPVLAQFLTAAERSRNIWLSGKAGSGKTTMPEQYAARTGRPFVRIAFQRAIEPVDLIGMLGLDGKGGMKWRDGVLTRAIRMAGTVILLDEITMAPAGLAAVIQTLLDMRFLTLPTGERVDVADGVVFVAADNTAGFGDTSGLYAGTTTANAALVDRMARVIDVPYLSAALEAQALHNHVKDAPANACRRLVDFMQSARNLPGFEDRPLSLRRMVAFMEMVVDGFSPQDALKATMLSRLPDAEREAFRQHFGSAFDAKEFKREMDGVTQAATTHAATQSDSPEQVRARAAFGTVHTA